MAYNASNRLAGSIRISWGDSIAGFERLTKAAGLDVEKEIEKVKDRSGAFLKARAFARTPVKTGKAKLSWAMSTTGSGKKRTVVVFNTAKNKKGLYYLNFVERGTVNIAPRRFFAKAIAEAKGYEQMELKKLGQRIARRFNNGSKS